MNEESNSSMHWSFWVIGVSALVWNAGGCFSYLNELNKVATENAIPAWVTGAFGIAVWGGALGCVLLLLRKSLALYLFIASLAGVVVQMSYNLLVTHNTDPYGPGAVAMIIMIPAIAAFLIWYTKIATSKGWVS